MATSPISCLLPLSQPAKSPKQSHKLNLLTSLMGANAGVGTGPSRQMIQSLAQLDQRKSQLSKSAVGVIEGSNLVEAATNGLKSQRSTLAQIEAALETASGELTEEERASLQVNINQLVEQLSKKADSFTYQGAPVLSGKQNKYVVTLPDRGNRSLSINLITATPEALGVKTLDISTPESIANSLKSVKTAAETIVRGHNNLIETYNKLSQSASDVQREIDKIIQTQSILDPSGAVNIASGLNLSSTSQFGSALSTDQMLLANLAFFL